VRLFTVPIRTFLLYKSQVMISFKGEGFDTPSVLIIAIVTLQYRHHVSTVFCGI
jgi:hypothetical protein